jgi:3-methyladenine DNA glycosylase AlkD
VIAHITAALEARAIPEKKDWWERYLKHEIDFLGVPMAEIRTVVLDWIDEMAPDESTQRATAFDLLRCDFAEQKLAGILILQEHLLPSLHPTPDLADVSELFDAGHIWEWSTCDWLCVRVLGPMARRDGPEATSVLAAWTDAPGLWRRRAAAVSFVGLAKEGDAIHPGFTDLVLDVCRANVTDPARFAQTGVGWVLRDLSDAAPDRVVGFVQDHGHQMSREAIRMAAARLPDEDRRRFGLTGPRRRR